jgi:hypothetical protein
VVLNRHPNSKAVEDHDEVGTKRWEVIDHPIVPEARPLHVLVDLEEAVVDPAGPVL